MNPLKKLEELKEKYKKELPSKLTQIQDLFEIALKKGLDKESFEEFYRFTHNLVGSGATFGLVEVSSAARALEDALRPFKTSKETLSAKEAKKIQILMEELIQASKLKVKQKHVSSSNNLQTAVFNLEKQVNNTNGSIYLVDDDPYIHEEFKIQLENFGYQVTSFLDTKSFELAAKEKAPDVVLMDIIFPKNDHGGIETIQQVRKQISKPFILFFISARDDFKTRAKAVKAGSDGFITKPIDIAALIDKLDRLTKRKSSEQIRVLLLDDEPEVAEFHASLLNAEGIETKCITNPEDILNEMSEYHPDLVLTDFYIPHYNGVEVTKVIRQIDDYLTIPIIYLSVESDVVIQSEAIGLGAEDFILKPVDIKNLLLRVRSKAERYKKMREKIEHDSLTKLYNHTTIIDLLSKVIAGTKRHKHALSFAMIDLDNFKQVNDVHGHQAGDSVLKTLSRFLIQRVRTSDMVGRYGGEEFCIILPDTEAKDALKFLNEMRKKFAKIKHFGNEKDFHVTFSCGICQWTNEESEVMLIEHADQAMYQAKKSGRNKVVEYK